MEFGRFNAVAYSEARLANDCLTKTVFLGNAHQEVYSQVLALRDEVNVLSYYSVYTALVQTSGLGKTRAVFEMSRLGVYICYCSLAGVASGACPPRTSVLADKLANSFNEVDMVLYLKAWLLVLAQDVSSGVTEEAWKNMQLPQGDAVEKWDNELAKRVRTKWDELQWQQWQQQQQQGQQQVDPDTRNEVILTDAIQAIETLLQGSARVIFIFDEARGLHQLQSELMPPSQSPFYQIRRALRVFFGHMLFFALMLDTSAKMSNLLPRRSSEDSNRALRLGVNLLPPIYYIPNLNLYKPVPGLGVADYTSPWTWMRYGRPLWASRLDHEKRPDKLVQLASHKLVCVLQGDFQESKVRVLDGIMTQSQAMAVLSASTGLEICPRSQLSELMSASHMNLVLRVSEDRSRIFVGLPMEPILAEAAAAILKKDIVKEKVLEHMEDACMAGYVTPGPRGEFVAKFILVAAIWSLKSPSDPYYLRPYSVDEFLKKLLVAGSSDRPTFSNLMRKRNWESCPEEGYVFFNSFVAVSQPPDAPMLGKCFAAGQAIMYRAENNLPGADIVIPVWTPKGMTGIIISVKDLAHPGWLKTTSIDKMKCEYTKIQVGADVPVLTIVMSLREPSQTIAAYCENWLLWDEVDELQNPVPNDRHIHLTCYGIARNYMFLSDKVKDKLKYILLTVPDPMSGATEQEKERIIAMLPEKFEAAHQSYANLRLESVQDARV